MKLKWHSKYDVTTTVGELVAELLKCDQGALVFTEGCGGRDGRSPISY